MQTLPKQPTILITGATDGIGQTTANLLAQQGARIIVHGRNPEKVERTRANLPPVANGEPHVGVVADLSSLQASDRLAEDIGQLLPNVHVLLLNAGIFAKQLELTADGFESTMAVNHFSQLLLLQRLVENQQVKALQRIVLVSSIAHTRGKLDLDNITLSHGPFDGYQAYAASKLANVLLAKALAPRLQQRAITVNALHPGVVNTNLLRAGFGQVQAQDSLEQGSLTSVYLAMAPAAAEHTGLYFVERQPAPIHALCQDAAFVNAFYEQSCRKIGCTPLPLPISA